jgi:hypothetical protein
MQNFRRASEVLGAWKDGRCSGKHHFVCKLPKPATLICPDSRNDIYALYNFSTDVQSELNNFPILCAQTIAVFNQITGGSNARCVPAGLQTVFCGEVAHLFFDATSLQMDSGASCATATQSECDQTLSQCDVIASQLRSDAINFRAAMGDYGALNSMCYYGDVPMPPI